MNLEDKIKQAQDAISCFYEAWDGAVYISFSGGKDSTVLLHIARTMYPNIKAVFVNTGLEYPEIVLFVKTFDNVDIIRPKKNFKWVIENVGYPVISKKQAMFIGYLQNPTDKNKNMRELIVNGVTTNGNKCTAYLLSKKYYPLIKYKVVE